MAGINLRKFHGIAPKVSPELLPDTSGQTARNTKLYSGDLIAHPQPVIVGDSGRAANTRTLYGIRNPANGALAWLTWDKHVDVAVITTEKGGEFRFFYTGDGPPKMSTYLLATSGPPPYPYASGFYYLGMPLPNSKLTAVVSPFASVGISQFFRNAEGTVFVTTTAPHNIKDRGLITVTGFTYKSGNWARAGNTVTCQIFGHHISGAPSVPIVFTSGDAISGTYPITPIDADRFYVTVPTEPTTNGNCNLMMSSFNAVSVPATVTGPSSLTYYAPGYTSIADAGPAGTQVALGGNGTPRTYVYTWYNEFGEESIGSDPSDMVFVKEGEIVTVTNIPSGFGDPTVRVNGVRLYRSVGSAAQSEYMLLKTLWFPKQTVFRERNNNTATVGFNSAHNMVVGDRFRIWYMVDGSFDVAEAVVSAVPDPKSISYGNPGGNVGRVYGLSGGVYYDIAEDPTYDPPRYWGFADFNFVDDFDSTNLTEPLITDNFEQPPDNLEGLITAQNGMLAGFVKNTVYFSMPYKPHAWPSDYAVTLDYEVVALALMSGAIIVLTTGYPFIISGNDPAAVSVRRIDSLYPCINRNSVVSMNYGVVYSTHDGLAVVSTQLSGQIATKVIFNNDTWHAHIDPHNTIAEFYGDAYIASWPGGSFLFEPLIGEQAPPYFIDYDPIFSAPWYDPINGTLYYARADNSSIYDWDPNGGVPLVQQWKSKVFKTPDMINIGAARVIADYPAGTPLTTATAWEDFDTVWDDIDVDWYAMSPSVEFSLWADKRLAATVQVGSDAIFRLPSGYRTDTFEVAVKADVRVRAIHLAETPYALRQV